MARLGTAIGTGRRRVPALCALILAACTVGPDYRAPAVTAPERWRSPPGPSEAHALKSLSQWWRGFHDPTLNRLIERALRQNPDLAAASARLKATRAEIVIAEAAGWPSLDALASYQRERLSPNAFKGILNSIQDQASALGTGKNLAQPGVLSPIGPLGTPFDLFLAGFDSTWELDLFGGIARREEAAQANAEAAEAGRDGLEVTLAAEVARLYLETVALECRARVAHARLEDRREEARWAEAAYAEGFIGMPEVHAIRDRLEQEQAIPPHLQEQVEWHRHALALLLGQRPGELDRELSRIPEAVPAPPAIPVGLPSDLLRRRPDLRQAERRVAAASALVGAAVAELFPKISLTGAVGFQSQELSNFVNPSSGFYGFGPRLSLPIFQAGRLKAQVETREALLEETERLYRKAVLDGFREVEDSLSALRSENARLAAETRALREAAEANRGTEAFFWEGEADFRAVLEARRAWRAAQDRQIQSSQRWAVGHVALVKALGGGWSEPAHRD